MFRVFQTLAAAVERNPHDRCGAECGLFRKFPHGQVSMYLHPVSVIPFHSIQLTR
jgi:hypothetical protein